MQTRNLEKIMIKYKTSNHKKQRKLDSFAFNERLFELADNTEKEETKPTEPKKGIPLPIITQDVVLGVSGKSEPHLETYEEFEARHIKDVHPIEIRRLWEFVLERRKK